MAVALTTGEIAFDLAITCNEAIEFLEQEHLRDRVRAIAVIAKGALRMTEERLTWPYSLERALAFRTAVDHPGLGLFGTHHEVFWTQAARHLVGVRGARLMCVLVRHWVQRAPVSWPIGNGAYAEGGATLGVRPQATYSNACAEADLRLRDCVVDDMSDGFMASSLSLEAVGDQLAHEADWPSVHRRDFLNGDTVAKMGDT